MFWFGFHLVAVTQTISFEPSLIQTETTEMALDAEGGWLYCKIQSKVMAQVTHRDTETLLLVFQ